LVINEAIRITVIQVSGRAVRLGIEAPPDVHVVRQELISLPARGARPLEANGHADAP
jgi:carbon storage regulator CsrA